MPDYQKMYAIMFNAATDALNALDTLGKIQSHEIAKCRMILIDAQLKCEDLYINAPEDTPEAAEPAKEI